jgi:Na+/proline symporter
MNDEQLSQLFRTGTATERDVAFVERTNRSIWSLQQISALMMAVKICCVTMLAVGLLVLTQTYPTLNPADDSVPSLISVVLPLFMAVVCSAVVAIRRHAQ